MQREDTQPWYRQFWPWFIIALPASAVIGGLYTVWLSLQSADSLVVSSTDGIEIVTERNLAAERQAARLGLSATVEYQELTGVVVVTVDAIRETTPPQTLRLALRHPTIAARDIEVDLQRAMARADGRPVWTGHFTTPPVGRFHLMLAAGDEWRLSSTWSGEALTMLGNARPPGHGGN